MSGRRPGHGQNFLRSRELVRKLLDRTSITGDDLVLDIGAGQGELTEALTTRCRRVVAYEIDARLFRVLQRRLGAADNATLVRADFLKCELPHEPYKVFANLPFNITADVVAKLTSGTDPPRDAHLIVQREAAERFVIEAESPSTLVGLLLAPRWSTSILARLPSTAFRPRPSVQAALLRLNLRPRPLLDQYGESLYRDLVTHAVVCGTGSLRGALRPVLTARQLRRLSRTLGFRLDSSPRELRIDHWLGLCRFVREHVEPSKRRAIAGSYARLRRQQSRLRKWHRTRSVRQPD